MWRPHLRRLTSPAQILLSPLNAATWRLIKAEPLKVSTFIIQIRHLGFSSGVWSPSCCRGGRWGQHPRGVLILREQEQS